MSELSQDSAKRIVELLSRSVAFDPSTDPDYFTLSGVDTARHRDANQHLFDMDKPTHPNYSHTEVRSGLSWNDHPVDVFAHLAGIDPASEQLVKLADLIAFGSHFKDADGNRVDPRDVKIDTATGAFLLSCNMCCEKARGTGRTICEDCEASNRLSACATTDESGRVWVTSKLEATFVDEDELKRLASDVTYVDKDGNEHPLIEGKWYAGRYLTREIDPDEDNKAVWFEGQFWRHEGWSTMHVVEMHDYDYLEEFK